MEGDEEAKGGEGNLYLTDIPGHVAKIYNAEHLTAGRRDKLDEMLRHDPQICGPVLAHPYAVYQHGRFCRLYHAPGPRRGSAPSPSQCCASAAPAYTKSC